VSKIIEFITLFQKWNEKINLSAASSKAEIEEHVEDSRQVAARVEGRVLGVGSGGGFPVVVAAIERPEVSFVSLEPIHKKHAFLRTAARTLGLANLEALALRIEDHDVHDYDVAMSRATFDLLEWLSIGAGHVRDGGIVLGFEGQPRADLPPVDRQAYEIAGKPRAIITFHVKR